MTQLQLTLTEEHYKQIAFQYNEWFEHECNSYEESGLLHPLTLQFKVPNPWRRDIENAPRDGRAILANMYGSNFKTLCWIDYAEHWVCPLEGVWHPDDEITCWMEIPELLK